MPPSINPKTKVTVRNKVRSGTKPGSTHPPEVIRNVSDYRKIMARIDALMNKGSEGLKRIEISELRQLATLAEGYEEAKYAPSAISTIAGLLDQKMYDLRLSQGAMARMLGVSDAKLSLILSGRQKPDVPFLKAIHQKLDIDANLLMNMI